MALRVTWRARRGLVLAGGMLLTACSTWIPVGPSPAEYIQSRRPKEVRIVRADSSKLLLLAPRMAADTVLGARPGRTWPDTTWFPVPLDSVRGVYVQRLSAGRSLAMVGLLAGGVLLAGAASCASSSDDYC